MPLTLQIPHPPPHPLHFSLPPCLETLIFSHVMGIFLVNPEYQKQTRIQLCKRKNKLKISA